MWFTVLLILVIAGFVARAAYVDLKRADQRRRARERRSYVEKILDLAGHPTRWTLTQQKVGDSIRFSKKVDTGWLLRQVGDPYASGEKWKAAMYPNLWVPRRCRWCQVLGRLGLSHHAMHYRPKHRAGA